MTNILRTWIIFIFSSVYAFPISQPVYQNQEYVSAQAVPAYTTFKQPQAQGLQYNIQPQIQSVQPQYVRAQIQPQIQSVQPQYVRAQTPSITPVYETSKEGLQNYGKQSQTASQQVSEQSSLLF